MMGDKIEAKKIAKQHGLPIIEGSDGGISDINEAKKLCKNIKRWGGQMFQKILGKST